MGTRALSVPAFSRISQSRVRMIHMQQVCDFTSNLSWFKCRLLLKEICPAPFPLSAPVSEGLHQERDRADQYNMIQKRKKIMLFCSWICSLFPLLL